MGFQPENKMLKINVVAFKEWAWRTTINIAPWPLDIIVKKMKAARDEKWFQKTMREDMAFRTMVQTTFEITDNSANEGRYEEIYTRNLETNKQLESQSQGC
jgi:hypothetical protein